jgi:hypothetical protein
MLVSLIRLWVSSKPFKLKHKAFAILFFLPGTNNHIPLIDLPTLKEAKELAESYYTQWVQVKDHEAAR